ncbi:hypothetical protein Tco_0336304 [Tanacetum coccineum]
MRLSIFLAEVDFMAHVRETDYCANSTTKAGVWLMLITTVDIVYGSKSDAWIGFNFMEHQRFTIDNESTICIVKNPIHTDHNAADLLTKAFDVSSGQIHAIIDGKVMVISESSVRSDLLFNDEDGIACLSNDEIFENLALMGYEQFLQNLLFKKGDSPRRQETIRGAPAQTMSERVLEKPNEPPLLEGHTSGSGEGSMEHTFELTDNVPNTPHDSPLSGGYTPGSDKGRMELIQELMETCTSLTKRVLALEEAKTAQDRVITRLKLRVNMLEKKRKARTLQPMKRRLFKGRVESSDDDLDEEDASKQGRTDDKTKLMFQDSEFDELDDDMDNVEGETVNTATTGVSAVSAPVTTAGVAISTAEPSTPPTTTKSSLEPEEIKL